MEWPHNFVLFELLISSIMKVNNSICDYESIDISSFTFVLCLNFSTSSFFCCQNMTINRGSMLHSTCTLQNNKRFYVISLLEKVMAKQISFLKQR